MSAPKVDASEFKGILPAHMRQGIPPYLQVLFSARPKLPQVRGAAPPHPVKLQGFFCGIDYDRMKEHAERERELRLAAETQIPPTSLQTFSTSIKKARRAREWKAKMETHLARQKQDYEAWVAERNKSVGNRSYEPRNTIVVSKLVA